MLTCRFVYVEERRKRIPLGDEAVSYLPRCSFISIFGVHPHHNVSRNQIWREMSYRRSGREHGRHVLHVLHNYYNLDAGDVSCVLGRFRVCILHVNKSFPYNFITIGIWQRKSAEKSTHISQNCQMIHRLCFEVQWADQEYCSLGVIWRYDLLADGEER